MKICCGGGLNTQAQWPLEIPNECGFCGHALVQDGYHIGQELWRCRCGTSEYTYVVGIRGGLQHIGVYFNEEWWGFHNYYNMNRWIIDTRYKGIWEQRCSGSGCWPLSGVEVLRAQVGEQLNRVLVDQ